jgi:hypothetical protein
MPRLRRQDQRPKPGTVFGLADVVIALGRRSSTRPAPACPSTHSTRQCRIVADIVWEQDGEEQLETEALGWTGQNVSVRLPDPRYRFTAVWLDAADVKRR